MNRWCTTIVLTGLAALSTLQVASAASTKHPGHFQRPRPPLVFVLAGQSNMAGRAFPLPPKRPLRRVLTLTAEGRLIPAVDPLGDEGEGTRAGSGAGVGPGLTFGRSVSSRLHRRVILLMCALGGSSASQWLPGQPLFDACMARARKARRYGPVAGIIDIQGETDAMDATTAPLWAERFEAFLAGAWANLGRVPVVFGQIGEIRIDTFPYRDVVQTEQASLRLPCVRMVRTSDLSTGADATHFTAGSDVTLGRRLASGWLALHSCR